MPSIELLLLALGLGMDAFAVCLAAGALEETRGLRPTFRLAFHFGLFQFMMPVVGWWAGAAIGPFLRDYDRWIAAGLLGLVGVRMVYSALTSEEEKRFKDPSRGWTLVLLSIAVSLDALAVGLSLGVMADRIWYPALLIGVTTSILSLFGLRIGSSFGKMFGRRVEIIGGLVLIGIGLKFLTAPLI